MGRLIFLLLGEDFLRGRWPLFRIAGWISTIAGIFLFIDALDGALYFPITFFAILLLIEGAGTLATTALGAGGQRWLRFFKGSFALLASGLILAGHHHGNFLLSMIFGIIFLLDGVIQCAAAYVVRYQRWKYVFAGGVAEILVAIFFFQPYPTHYVGTVPYFLGLFLIAVGLRTTALARFLRLRTGSQESAIPTAPDPAQERVTPAIWDGPPAKEEHALIVHVWTPAGSAKSQTRNYPLVNRYIAAVDANGTISTGHAALETPEGIYISLYPAQEIDRSPEQFGTILRATRENDVPGVYQPDYATESHAWCPSNEQVRIRNYDPAKLSAFWEQYRQNSTYNLTHRNCSSTVAQALEAAVNGAMARLHGTRLGWKVLLRLLLTPELWVAAQIRKRATTMAWTPGLTLDYARAMSMLADPRPFGWWVLARSTVRRMRALRQNWRKEDSESHAQTR
ncbi:MAG: DUF308 domain-containing protein [Ottowia sp.]|uniref:HdeD family acid-resistance protein n=1 Tax=Ottowia sp. TaxID=1898956 RepID=UPI003C76CB32